jgi:hypothetical protein
VKDLDFDRHAVVVGRGKGQKERTTQLPAAPVEPLRAHLDGVRRQHKRDVHARVGRMVLPEALDRKYPNDALHPCAQQGTAGCEEPTRSALIEVGCGPGRVSTVPF